MLITYSYFLLFEFLIYYFGPFFDGVMLFILIFSEPFIYTLKTITLSFLIWIPFISFSSLIAVAKTYETMLNNSGESGQLCLLPDLRGNGFSFSPLRMMLAVGLSYTAFIMLR